MGGLAAILGTVLGPVLDRLFPDPIERQKVALEMEKQAQAADLAQIEVNKIEAASSSMFVAGWRPFIGWVCGVALAWEMMGRSVAISIASMISEKATTAILNAPQPNSELMWVLVSSMLGIAGFRTFEKVRGVAK